MITSKRKFKAEFKSKVALEAVKEQDTIEIICKRYDLHPTQVTLWKKELLSKISMVFTDSSKPKNQDQTKLINELYRHIGELNVANDFLKKKSH